MAFLFWQLLIGAFMIGLTVMVHAIGLDFIIRRAGRLEKPLSGIVARLWKPLVSAGVVMSVFCVHIAIIWMWSFLYLIHQCQPLHDFAETLYFATVTYSTLGFGDIILEPSCRMLSGIEGANGFLLFGWTTAFIFEIVSQIYRKEARAI